MDQITVVLAPQLGVNDLDAIISAWRVEEGSRVTSGEPLLDLETTKATFEVDAEASGFVVHLAPLRGEVRVNEPVGLIGPDLDALMARKASMTQPAAASTATQQTAEPAGEVKATEKARELARKLGIDLAEIKAKGIIREADVLAHKASAPKELPDNFKKSDRPAVAIYGAGKGAITVRECLEMAGKYEPVCFLDDSPKTDNLEGLPVYHGSVLDQLVKRGVQGVALAVGSSPVRLKLRDRCADIGIELINAIHPAAYIAPSAKIGKGNYIKAAALIDTNTTVGDCCIIDNGAIVPHDNVIGDGVHIAPGVAMGGFCTVGDRAILGIGCSITASVKVGKSAIVSVGAAVTREVPDFAVVEGSPARVIGMRNDAKAKSANDGPQH